MTLRFHWLCLAEGHTKWLRIVKLLAIILLAAGLSVQATGHGQTITISAKDAPLEKVLKEIETQSGYPFFYTVAAIQKGKPVDISIKNASLEEALALCFKNQPLTYSIVDKVIVVKEKTDSPNAAATAPQKPLIDVRGRITNEDGEAVAASVQVKGTNKGTTTDANGEFAFNGIDPNAILRITGVSIEPIEESINGRNVINLTAKRKIDNLQEVIVKKGYYDEKKATSASNVTTVTAKEIEKQPVGNPLLALQGRTPGAFIRPGFGLPGSSVSIQIRGQNSIAQGNEPLYIVDGVPFPSKQISSLSSGDIMLGTTSTGGNTFAAINPTDIESISILKDADATAIYGSRGANGVVLITTKKGKAGKMRLDLNLQTGFSQLGKKMKLLNTEQYLEMRREAFKNDGATPNPNADFDLTLWDQNRNTDWQEELIGGTAEFTDLQAGISGGTELAQYRFNVGYNRQTTVFPDDRSNNRKFARLNISANSPNKKIHAQASVLYTIDNGRLPAYDLTRLALALPPNAPALYNADGSINWAPGPSGASTWPGYTGSPLTAKLSNFVNDNYTLLTTASIGFRPIKGLELNTHFGYTTLRSEQIQTLPLSFIDPYVRPTANRRASFITSHSESWNIEPQANYTAALAGGELSLQAGISIQQVLQKAQHIQASGFTSDLTLENLSDASVTNVSNAGYSLYKYNALFGRVGYSFQRKYTVNLTANRNGSSNFGPANRFNTFGSVGAAYTFSNEAFIQNLLPFLSFGKLRASYGTTGSDQVGTYSYLDLYAPLVSPVLYQGTTGYLPTRIYTPDLQWEETRKMELGIELGFLKNRINAEISYYRNRSSNQLLATNLSTVTGFSNIMQNLDALVQNQGWEFLLNTTNVETKKFCWTTSFNLSLNRNRLLSIPDDADPWLKQRVGLPLGIQFMYHYLGVNIITGLYEFADSEGKPTSNPNGVTDQIPVDLTAKFYGGFQNTVTFKGLELDFLFQFARQPRKAFLFGDQPGSFSGLSLGGSNQPATVLDRWREPGDVAPIQRYSQRESGNVSTAIGAAAHSDMLFTDAFYIRLKNLSLSWQIPDRWKQKFHLQNLRFSVLGQNLLTFTRFQGLDPELSTPTNLPPLRTITFKISVSL